MRFPRSAGVLLHPTSLPSPYGVGDLGEAAYRFVDFLKAARQTVWQILPLGPTGYGDSPYQSFSAFAGNPLLISPDRLVSDGYLPQQAVAELPSFPSNHTDYGSVIPYKTALYRLAFAHFEANGTSKQQHAFEQFCATHKGWLDDFALFMAIKTVHVDQDGGVWNRWPEPIARREPSALATWSKRLSGEITLHKFLQFLVLEQWGSLRKYANAHQIKIIGDAPIFVAFDSADVWAHPQLFHLGPDGSPSVIAGVPPDYFSETGQRWGNPLYRWQEMEKNDFVWWSDRLRAIFEQVDAVRLDHFRGFAAYWEIPAEEPTAVIGQWKEGPGQAFFRAMQRDLGDLPIIAEDLGVITDDVISMRQAFEFPGMKILQFAFGGEKNSSFLPHTFTANNVVYTGTHDNETTVGWYQNASESERDHLRRYLGSDGHDVAWDLIRLAYASVADMAIIPVQDLMQLDNSARMNYPGKASGYWQWRFTPGMLTDVIGYRLAEMTEMYGRSRDEKAQPGVDRD